MDGLGTELPQRTVMARILVAMAVVLTVPGARAATDATHQSGGAAVGAWAMVLGMVLLLVVLPLALARSIHRRHTYVSDEAVTVLTGDVLQQRVAYADLTEIRVRVSGQGGAFFRNERVFLIGPGATGKPSRVLVSRLYVITLRPLLERLSAEAGRRPELLAGDLERDYFERAVATAP